MQKVSLLIDDDFIDQFMQSLPKDKIIVVEDGFNSNVELFKTTIKDYEDNQIDLIPYNDSAKNLTSWLDGVKL